MNRALATAAFLLAALGASGCALTSRGAVLSVRYFAPALSSARAESRAAPGPRPTVRLGRVRGAQFLRERIAYRESPYEIAFYEDREWTERPEDYVRRALAHELFEERGFQRATGSPAPTLEVEVLAFEQVKEPPVDAARVEVRYRLENDLVALDERTITVDRPVRGRTFQDFVAAISGALDEVTGRIADRIAEVSRQGAR